MFESTRPFRALLSGSKLGDTFRKLAHLRGTDSEEDEESKKRPRILVSSNEQSDKLCSICMGKIKGELEYGYCDKRSFHVACLDRLDGCPFCKMKYAVRGRESTTTSTTRITLPKNTTEKKAPAVDNNPLCPVCHERVAMGDGSCSACGAIFVAAGETFPCPACDFPVSDTSATCPNCGEQFRPFEPRTCPICGKLAGANEMKCECGALLGNKCPDCGFRLSEKDAECSNCGAIFEFV